MTEDDVALFFHLLGAFAFVAATIVAGIAFETARRTTDAAEIAPPLGLTGSAPSSSRSGRRSCSASGLWLVHLGACGSDAGWVDAALGLLAATATLGAAGGQKPTRARKLASGLAADGGRLDGEPRALLDDRATLAVNHRSAPMPLAIVAPMVFKPGAPHS